VAVQVHAFDLRLRHRSLFQSYGPTFTSV
jgi:hypothetical protein